MMKLLFSFAIFAVFFPGCKKTDGESGIRSLALSHYQIVIGNDKGELSYQDFPADGYNDTVRILDGNGKYKLMKIQNTMEYFPDSKIRTKGMIIGDSVVVINIKVPAQEEGELNLKSLMCIDIYCVTDAGGEKREFKMKSAYNVGDIDI